MGVMTAQVADADVGVRSVVGEAFGLHPTFVRVAPDGAFRVASRAADLATDRAVVDVEKACALLSFTSPERSTRTIFEGVLRAPPDATLSLRADGPHVTPRTRTIELSTESPVEAADRIWRALVDSVKKAIGSATRVAVLAGGGIDSSAVLAAALATKKKERPGIEVEAIALDFGGVGDDRPYMRELERALGIRVTRVAPEEAGSTLLATLGMRDLPGWSWSLPTDLAMLRRARSLGADVVLTGLGGDDVFEGTPRSLADDLLRGDPRALSRAARLRSSPESPAGRILRHVLRPIAGRALSPSMRTARRRRAHAAAHPWAGPVLREYLNEESIRWRPASLASPSDRFDSIAKAGYLADGVELCEELARLAGVRLEHPLLDERLNRIAAAQPPSTLLHGDRLRGLFRLALRGYVPEAVRLRPTKAFFLEAWRDSLRAAGGFEALRDLSFPEECARLGLVDAERFARDLVHLEKDDVTWTMLWPVLGMEGFLRARRSDASSAGAASRGAA